MKMSIHGRLARRPLVTGAAVCLLSVGTTAFAGIVGGDLRVKMQSADGRDLDVLGLVANTDEASGSLVVSGQTVRLTSTAKLAPASDGAQSRLPAKGVLVAVYGAVNSDGTISASEIDVVAQPYVPGATTLYVRGIVHSANPSLGRAQVGNLSIDYTGSLYAASASAIQAGSIAEFAGLQTSGATLYASKAAVLKSSKPTVTTNGIIGGDKATVSTNGIIGGDKATISTNGIIGGDKATVTTMGIIGGD